MDVLPLASEHGPEIPPEGPGHALTEDRSCPDCGPGPCCDGCLPPFTD